MISAAMQVRPEAEIELDLHGYHPDDICGTTLATISQKAWQTGASCLRLIHGHGRNRGISVGFVNTNTGYFGLRIRAELRHNDELWQWVKRSTLDCSHEGSTTIKVKKNPAPTLGTPDWNSLLPERTSNWRKGPRSPLMT